MPPTQSPLATAHRAQKLDTIESITRICRALRAETRPHRGRYSTRFVERIPLVFKTANKMFALLGHLNGQPVVSLKCDPEQAVVLRGSFPAITAGYHLNKKHWNTLSLDGSLPAPLLTELIDHAYDLVARVREKSARKRAAAAPGKRRSRG